MARGNFDLTPFSLQTISGVGTGGAGGAGGASAPPS